MSDRSLEDSKEWKELLDILQMDDYGIMGDYYEGKPRTNGLTPTSEGGYRCEDKDGKCLFEISSYWWGDCTCGASVRNADLEEKLYGKYNVTSDDRSFLLDMELKMENAETLTEEEKERFTAVRKRIDKADREYEELEESHDPSCKLVTHNFIYRPGTEEEFWIDWYKYPFRDSYMSKKIPTTEIREIFKKCAEEVGSRIG